MDEALTAILGAAPQLGAATGAIAFCWLLVRWTQQDRTDYRAQLTEAASRHADELARINAAHDAELAELRTEMAGLRTQISDLHTKLDAERDRRRAAEDRRMGPGRHSQEQPWG